MFWDLVNIRINFVIRVVNENISRLASDPNFAKTWMNTNVILYYLVNSIILIIINNGVIPSNNSNLMKQMLLVILIMQNIFNTTSLGNNTKVSTMHSIKVHKDSKTSFVACFMSSLSLHWFDGFRRGCRHCTQTHPSWSHYSGYFMLPALDNIETLGVYLCFLWQFEFIIVK